MDEASSEQLQSPPQIIEKPRAVWVFGVLNIAVGCYQLINFFLTSFKMVMGYVGLFTIEGLP